MTTFQVCCLLALFCACCESRLLAARRDLDQNPSMNSAVGVLPAFMEGHTTPSLLSVAVVSPDAAEDLDSARQSSRDNAASLKIAMKKDLNGALSNLFVTWSAKYGKKYQSLGESSAAFAAFQTSVSAMVNANSLQTDFWIGLNQFSGTPFDTLKSQLLHPITAVSAPVGRSALQMDRQLAGKPTKAPSTSQVNWATAGRTTPVKDQGSCGSCWAFAAATAIESSVLLQYPNASPFALSTQMLVDCDNSNYGFYSGGCNGGNSEDPMAFTAKYLLTLGSAYPYTSGSLGATGTCNTSMLSLPVSSDNWVRSSGSALYAWLPAQGTYGFDNVIYPTAKSESALMAAVAVQPVVFYFQVVSDWFGYGGGVYTATSCGTSTNHAMVLVGYDVSNAANRYWIVQNSWGTGWGMSGFAYVAMTGDGDGPCGMYDRPLAPRGNYTVVPSFVSASGPAPAPAPVSPKCKGKSCP